MALRRSALVLVTGLLLVAACTDRLESRQRHTDLADRLREFTALIRWGYFDAAAGMQLPRILGNQETAEAGVIDEPGLTPEPELPGSEAIEGANLTPPIRIISVDHVGQTFNDVGDEVYVVSIIGYYRTDTQTLRQLRYRHTWWYHSERKRWFLDSELPRFE